MSQQLVRFINFGIDQQAPQKPDHGRRLYLLPNGDFATIDDAGVVTPLATDWDSITGKPSVFPPSSHAHPTSEVTGLIQNLADLEAADTALDARIDHLTANLDPAALDSVAEAAASIGTLQTQLDTHTHTASQITDFASAVVAVSPPVDWSSLTGKPATFAPSAHTHAISEVTGLTDALAGKATAAQGAKADTALQPEPVDYRGAYDNGGDYYPGQVVNFNGALYVRIGEPNPGYPPGTSYWAEFDPAASPAFKLWVDLSKADTIHTHTAADITDFADAVVAVSPPVDWSSLTGKPATFAPSAHTHTASQITDFTSAVVAAAPAPTTPSNSGLSITGNSLATAYNTAIADGVVSVSVGGAPAAPASAWKAKSLVQVLDDILFPTILASVGSAKSLDLAVSGTSGTLEIGTSVSRTLTATFARGTITNGSGSANANPLVGDATGYTFTGTGISSTAQAGNTLAITTAVVSGSNNWAVTATHAAGTGTYTDNKGVAGSNLAASRAAGSLTDSTSSPAITGVHPYYYLKSASPISASAMVTAIQNGTATKVIAASTGTLSIPYAPSAEYLAVAYPATSTTKTRYHVTALDNGAITVVFSPVATQTVTTALWSQSYRIHTSTGALTNSNATIELRNT
ncbi:MAG: hypothetical protein NTW41_05480 [Verrucomicrobia bacterium]|nr:hypothetical protein [Verrucomicrobiota bacterium]